MGAQAFWLDMDLKTNIQSNLTNHDDWILTGVGMMLLFFPAQKKMIDDGSIKSMLCLNETCHSVWKT